MSVELLRELLTAGADLEEIFAEYAREAKRLDEAVEQAEMLGYTLEEYLEHFADDE